MRKYFTKHGNSAAIIVDKPILELLSMALDRPIDLTTDGRNLIISPVVEGDDEERFQNSIKKVHARYGKTLKRLAE